MSASMPTDVRARCKTIRARSKKGEHLSPEDFQFLESAWRQWPEEYVAIGAEVFKETAPFGSQV